MSATMNLGELLNLIGLSTGVVLYAMLLAMVLRAGRAPGIRSRVDPLMLLTSILGLVWNLCALPAYELPKVGIQGPFPYLAAVGFGALGLLPAVVVHSVLRGERQGVRTSMRQLLVTIAYTVSAAAAVLQLRAAGAAKPDMVQACTEFRELPALDVPVVLVNSEQRAIVERPDQMSETCVGVFVEHRIGTDQSPVPGSADAEIAHGERDMVERREGHCGLLTVDITKTTWIRHRAAPGSP